MSYHGFFLEFVLHLRRTFVHHQLNWSVVHRSQFQVILLLVQTPTASPDILLRTLHRKVQGFMPVPTSQHGTQSSSVPSDLHSSQYVFVRHDCHCSPLEHPYEGLFRVITSSPKVFTIERGGKLETISVDRLKPAHLDFDMPVPTPTPRPRGRPRKRP